jgi:putative addiction module component (TIGR02574 family)
MVVMLPAYHLLMSDDAVESFATADVEAAWAAEIERRVREIDSGDVKTIPWEEVRAKLYARLDAWRA